MTSRKDFNTGYSSITTSSGMFRAEVVEADTQYLKVRVPRLGVQGVFENVPYFGIKPAVGETIIVGLLEGNSSSPVAITPSPYGETPGGGGSSVGGSNTQVQYNNSGVLAGSANMTFDGTSLNVAGLKLASTAITSTAAELNILDGVTSTAAELNILDGVTATTSELNILDGVTATAAEINVLDGVTGGTVTASKAIVVDANKDVTGFRNVTLAGELTIGVDDTGHDVKFFGATSGKYWEWDESNNQMHVAGNILVGEDATQSITFRTGTTGTEGLLKWVFNKTDGTVYATMGITYDDRATHGFYLDSAYPITLDATTKINFEISGTTLGYLESGAWHFGTSTQYVSLDYDSDGQMLKLGTNNNSGRPHLAFYNQDAYGNFERKGYMGYPHAANDTSRIYIRADQGYLDIGGTPGVYVNGSLYIGSTVGPILQNGSGDSLRINNDHGYIDIGAMNDGAEHIYASASTLFFGVSGNAEVRLNSTELAPSSNEGTNLGSSTYTWNKFWLGQAATFSSGGYYTLRSRDSDRQVMELTSSERFKKDIVDLPLSEAYKVLDARPIKYRGIDDDASVPLEVGLSAESLHNAGYEYAVRYDEGHWGETPRSIYYEYLTAPLIAIIKDLKTRLEALES